MTPQTTERIKQVLTAEAAALLPPTNLAEKVIKRGRRLRRVRSTAAAVVVVAAVATAVAIPIASLNGPDDQAPAAGVIREGELVTVNADPGGPRLSTAEFDKWYAGLSQGAGPRLPYAAGGYVIDGAVRVRMPAITTRQVIAPLGRVNGGWLLAAQKTGLEWETRVITYGILTTKGDFRQLAQGRLLGVVISPDRTQVAYATAEPRPTAVVVDVASGKTVASTPVQGDDAKPIGVRWWNPSGVWLDTAQGSARWTPGSPPDAALGRTVRAPARESELLQDRDGNCDRLLDPDGSPRIQYCGFSDPGTLSPKGTTFVTADGRAHGVYQPRDVQLQLIAGFSLGNASWEDDRYLLLSGSSKPNLLIRCDVTTGGCEAVPTDRRITHPPVN